ncbi:MAG TPA: type II toxin-antitoxin system PemK/MazF family toxin [Candidatus Mucispirillum faecigallinarum]|uniref:Type II toxin-antitoxin system PemK/MazF family toxin n=1 Tax=Candidatus Mucispirillum faecigallinarum TaxID=2838699 RepID=A0A9D2GW11_9BACT|nr:type II toxin-antitoxin system PemK/MazF family toxin [Candidatus Mucispirillum faecigallinarum]
MQKWDIWLANVRFEDNPEESKLRPVLVIDKQNMFILSFKMTSHTPRQNFYGEYSIKYYKEAGLVKPTVIRLSKKLLLLENEFIHQIGRLHPYDINEVYKILNSKK